MDMEQKIAKRLDELTQEINDLAAKRELLVKELRMMDFNIEILSSSIFELSKLLKDEDAS